MFSGLKSQQVRFRINKESQRNKTDVTVFVDLTLKKTENRTTGSESRKYNNLDSRDYISLCFFQVSVKDHCQYICLGQSIVASYSSLKSLPKIVFFKVFAKEINNPSA